MIKMKKNWVHSHAKMSSKIVKNVLNTFNVMLPINVLKLSNIKKNNALHLSLITHMVTSHIFI